jgi:hypothetical protein
VKQASWPEGQGDGLKLVRCAGCRNPIARLGPGSIVEVRCRRCGHLTRFELRRQ